MTPTEMPEWLKQYGPLGVAIGWIIVSIKAKTPDNPPKSDADKIDALIARVAHLETDVAILKDRSDR